ncbi:MAG: hypothetical protein AMXMBFR64_45660 [Myxococcales bacterium]
MAAPRIDLVAIAGLRPSDRRQRMRAIGQVIQRDWKAEADAALRSFRGVYKKNIVLQEATDRHVRIELKGTRPNMAEQGMGAGGVGTEGPYDIRRFVLKAGTKSLKQGKKGLYLNVPFGYSLADVRALGGAETAKAAKALAPSGSRIDIDAVRRFIRAHGRSDYFARSGARVAWGGRLGVGAPARLVGLIRYEKTYARATQNSPFMTWRRMSEGGKPWMHPGLKGHHLARRVLARVPQIVAMVS